MQEWFRSVWRFFYFTTSTVVHIAGFYFRVLSGSPKEQAAVAFKRKWLSHVPRKMGMHFKVEGIPFNGPCLYAANHISYLDPIVILMHTDAYIVAKAEVSKWPLVGTGAYIIGTIYVNRTDQTSRNQTASAVKDALKSGKSILVFPEGTTSAGPNTLPFRPRSFEAAHIAGVPVQPIAIKYDHKSVAFIDDDVFITHFFRLFRQKKITCRIAFGPLLVGENTCEEARQWIDNVQSPIILKPVEHA